MNAPRKFAGFTIGLAVIFAAAIGVGSALGPQGNESAPAHTLDTHDTGRSSDTEPTADLPPED